MNRTLGFILGRRSIFFLLAILTVIPGAAAFPHLRFTAAQEVSEDKAVILIFLPGSSPREIEERITAEIEKTLLGQPEVGRIRTFSTNQWSNITVTFREGVDPGQAYEELRRRVAAGRTRLPPAAAPPLFLYPGKDDWRPVVSLSVYQTGPGNGNVWKNLRAIAAEIRSIEGVGAVWTAAAGAVVPAPDSVATSSPLAYASINGRDCVSLQVIRSSSGNALRIAREVRRIAENFRPAVEREGGGLVVAADVTGGIRNLVGAALRLLPAAMGLIFLFSRLIFGLRQALLLTWGCVFSLSLFVFQVWLLGRPVNELLLLYLIPVLVIISGVQTAVAAENHTHRTGLRGLGGKAVISGLLSILLYAVTVEAVFLIPWRPPGFLPAEIAGTAAAAASAMAAALTVALFLPYRPEHGTASGGPASEARGQRGAKGREARLPRMGRRILEQPVMRLLHHRIPVFLILMTVIAAATILTASGPPWYRQASPADRWPVEPGWYSVEITGPVSTTIAETHEFVKKLAGLIRRDGKGMAGPVAGYAGYAVGADQNPVYGGNLGHLSVMLPPEGRRHFSDHPDNRVRRHLDRMRVRLSTFAAGSDFTVQVRPPVASPPAGTLLIRVTGPDLQTVTEADNTLTGLLRQDPVLNRAVPEDYPLPSVDDRGRPAVLERDRGRRSRTAILRWRADSGLSIEKTASRLEGYFAGVGDMFPGVDLSIARPGVVRPGDLSARKPLFLIALSVTYGILAVFFRSWRLPLALLVPCLFSLLGTSLGFRFAAPASTVLFPAALTGICVIMANESLALIRSAGAAGRAGPEPGEAVIAGAGDRHRPRIPVLLVCISSLLPFAAGVPACPPGWRDLAVVTGIGFGVAGLLTVLAVPQVCDLMGGRFRGPGKKKTTGSLQ